MDFKDKSELFDYLTSLEERLSELEKPKDESQEDVKPTDENKNEDDSNDIDEIEKLLED